MKCVVNGRLLNKERTGVQSYITNLYSKMMEVDTSNDYIFLQEGISKTRIVKTSMLPSILGDVLYDNISVSSIIKNLGADIYHSPGGILPLKKLNGIKYVTTVHDLAFKVYPSHYSTFFSKYYDFFLKKSLKNAHLILSVSESTKRDILDFYNIPPNKIVVVHSGVSQKYVNVKKYKPIRPFPYFFSVATQPKRKNISGVLKAIAQNPEIVRNHKYLIAGIINEYGRSYLAKLVNKYDLQEKVELLGYVSDKELISLYQNAEFFIYPSFYEGFGFPILESMCSKCPVITSNVSSMVELVPDNRWLVDPTDTQDIASKMKKMITITAHVKEKNIKENFDFAKKFTWKKTALETIEAFKQIPKQ